MFGNVPVVESRRLANRGISMPISEQLNYCLSYFQLGKASSASPFLGTLHKVGTFDFSG